MQLKINHYIKQFKVLFFMLLSAIFVFTFSNSMIIAAAFSLFVGLFLAIANRKSADKRSEEIQAAAPEMIDHLISGLQSGLSLNE